MDETFNAWSDLDERAVVGEDNDFTLNDITNFEVRVESIPWMWGELLETEGDAFLAVVEVEDNDLDLLVELDDFLRIVDTAP